MIIFYLQIYSIIRYTRCPRVGFHNEANASAAIDLDYERAIEMIASNMLRLELRCTRL